MSNLQSKSVLVPFIEICKRLGISYSTGERRRAKGLLGPVWKDHGGRWQMFEDDFQQLVADMRAQTARRSGGQENSSNE